MNDQYIIPLFVAGSLLLALFTFFLIAYLLVQKRKQNKFYLEKERMIFDHETNILRTKLVEKENIMDKMSKELHGNINSVLGFAQMRIVDISYLATNNEQLVMIDNAKEIIARVMNDIRNISHSLSSNFVKNIGLIETITKDLEQIHASKKITYNIEIKGDVISFGPERELYIYRIAQEALQNCIKHAQATIINFMFSYEHKVFTMKITDNGIGFDKKKVYEMKGLGFLNMFQRAKFVNGTLDIQSAPLEGSNITLTINLNQNGANN